MKLIFVEVFELRLVDWCFTPSSSIRQFSIFRCVTQVPLTQMSKCRTVATDGQKWQVCMTPHCSQVWCLRSFSWCISCSLSIGDPITWTSLHGFCSDFLQVMRCQVWLTRFVPPLLTHPWRKVTGLLSILGMRIYLKSGEKIQTNCWNQPHN